MRAGMLTQAHAAVIGLRACSLLLVACRSPLFIACRFPLHCALSVAIEYKVSLSLTCLLACVCAGIARRSPLLVGALCGVDPTYINILGVAKDPFLRFRGVGQEEDHWRRS